jgi:hypothetical protein
MRYTPENITKLKENEIFVFGSNTVGKHGKGAALRAIKNFGAVYGIGEGLSGKAYGIPTKDSKLYVLSLLTIEKYVRRFLKFATDHPELTFLVTKIGCGLSYYKPIDIAPMFFDDYGINPPKNVILPRIFWEITGRKDTKVKYTNRSVFRKI